MLVPDVDHAASLVGQPGGPIHVRIAEEREAGLHLLLREGVGEDVVHAELVFSLHAGIGLCKRRVQPLNITLSVNNACQVAPCHSSLHRKPYKNKPMSMGSCRTMVVATVMTRKP